MQGDAGAVWDIVELLGRSPYSSSPPGEGN
jgi:hypothetical protein